MKRYLICMLAVMITACGGGGSSGGAGGAVSDGGNNPFAGSYTGTATVTLSAPGVKPVTNTMPISIVISADGTIVVEDDGKVYGTGKLDGNSFAMTNAAQYSSDGITCTGPQSFSGTVSGTSITGRITGTANCTGPNGSVSISMNGTFSASAALTAAPVVPQGGYSEGLMDAIHRLMTQ